MTRLVYCIPVILLSLFYSSKIGEENILGLVVRDHTETRSGDITLKSLPVLKAGDIASDAKMIDADAFSDFFNGVAILQKGAAYAIINSKGEFVLPYTTDYRFGIKAQHGIGLFNVSKPGVTTNGFGIMNYKGEFLPVLGPQFTEDGKYANISWPKNSGDKSKYIYVDADFNKFSIEKQWKDVSEGLGTVNVNGKYGYKNKLDQYVIKPIYDYAGPFSEGIAVVGSRDNFGTMKYGLIDLGGKEITPLMFSTKPKDFSGGLIQVFPKDKSDFVYAYFDKRGQMVINHTSEDIKKYLGFTEFKNGFSSNSKYVMDITGKIVEEKEFLSSYGITGKLCRLELKKTNMPGKLIFSENKVVSGNYNRTMFGFIDLEKKKVVESAFIHSTDHNPFYVLNFDPVSKLAYAQVVLGRDANGKDQIREGFINEDGIFVIVKNTGGSKW
jgi:hypothetical protein